MSAVGLGFLLNDAVLQPLLVLFLVVTLFGLWRGWRRHGRPWALAVGAVSGAGLYVTVFVAYTPPLAYLAIAGLVAASILNVVLAMPLGPKSRDPLSARRTG